MKIIETSILDVQKDTVDKKKVELSNKFIDKVIPLIKDISIKRKDEIKKLKDICDNKKNQVRIEKENITALFELYNQEKEKNIFLNKIENLLEKGASTDSSLRNELIIMLKTLSNVSNESLNRYKKQVDKYISKRF